MKRLSLYREYITTSRLVYPPATLRHRHIVETGLWPSTFPQKTCRYSYGTKNESQLGGTYADVAQAWQKFRVHIKSDGHVDFYRNDNLEFSTTIPLDLSTYSTGVLNIRSRSLGYPNLVDDISFVTGSQDQPPDPTPTPRIEILHMEVTQAVQVEANDDVTLFADKDTVVRVYLRCNLNCEAKQTITGKLYGTGSQLPKGAFVIAKPIKPISTADIDKIINWQDGRGDVDKSLNFLYTGR